MKKFFTVYIKTDCPFCEKAIDLLDEKKIPFIVVAMDKNPDFAEKLKQDMKMTTIPVIIEQLELGVKIIGGFDNLEQYINSSEFTND